MIDLGGMPKISTIIWINSVSSSAGNIGWPVTISHRTQPRLQISISVPYSKPKTTSGAL